MMADRPGTLNIFYNVLLVVVFICCIKVNKARYLTSDGISITFNMNGSFDAVAERYTSNSFFIFKSNREFLCSGCRKKSFLILLLLLCSDIERCPGSPSITAFSKQKDKVCTSKHLFITKQNSSLGNVCFKYLVENWYYQFVRDAYQWSHK